MLTSRVSDFPWDGLPRLGREEISASREASVRLRRYFDLRRAGALSRELFAAELEGFGSAGGGFAFEPPPSLGADLRLSGAELDLWLSVEPQLLALLLNRLLGRPNPISVDKPLTSALHGALRAVGGEICRRLAPGEALVVAGVEGMQGPSWRSDFWLRLDGASFRGRLAVSLRGTAPVAHVQSGALPVTLAVVLTQQTLSRAEAAALEVGDVLVFDAAWELARALERGAPSSGDSGPGVQGSSAVLCSGAGVAGMRVELTRGGLVLRGPARVGYEASGMAQGDTTVNSGAEAAVLDTPVVVRLEVGEVTLSAREWLGLSPGDVLQTEVPIGDPVVLRVAGRVVARGTLVNVEGRLGVRLLQVSPT